MPSSMLGAEVSHMEAWKIDVEFGKEGGVGKVISVSAMALSADVCIGVVAVNAEVYAGDVAVRAGWCWQVV